MKHKSKIHYNFIISYESAEVGIVNILRNSMLKREFFSKMSDAADLTPVQRKLSYREHVTPVIQEVSSAAREFFGENKGHIMGRQY